MSTLIHGIVTLNRNSSFLIFIFFLLRVENFELNLTQESTNYRFLRELFERRKQIDENNQ